MLTITPHNIFYSEQRYALVVLRGEFLGLVIELHTHACEKMYISHQVNDKNPQSGCLFI